MSLEKLPYGFEQNNRLSEEERKLDVARNLEFSKEKKVLLEKIEKDKKLAYLKSLVERWLIRPSTVEHIIAGTELNSAEIREIFEKIDEIEQVANIEEILPAQFRITKEAYLAALEDPMVREQVLTTLNGALDTLYLQTHSHATGIVTLFTDIFGLLSEKHKTITKIQGNVIDMKRSVKKRINI